MTTINTIGRITKDFELKQSENGVTYANFGLAVNNGFGENQKPTFYGCTVFGRDAERIVKARARKGSLIQVVGKFDVSEYHNEAAGKSGVNLRVTVLGWSYIPGTGGKKDASNDNRDGDGNSNDSGNGGVNNNSRVPEQDLENYPYSDECPCAGGYPSHTEGHNPHEGYNGTTNLDDENPF